jgi:hypothetical protein
MPDEVEPSGAQKASGDFAPALVGFTDDVFRGVPVATPVRTERQRSRPNNAAALRVVNSARCASGKTSRNVVIASRVGCWNG